MRDSALGEMYERETLTKRIMVQPHGYKITRNDVHGYKYDRDHINALNMHYRVVEINSEKRKVKRNEVEQDIIADIKVKSAKVEYIQGDKLKMGNKPNRASQNDIREKYLIEQIGRNLRTLQFVEEKKIKSFGQIENGWKELEEKKSACEKRIVLIENALCKAEIVISQLPESERIEKMQQMEKYTRQCNHLKLEIERVSYEIERYKESYETLKALYDKECLAKYKSPFATKTSIEHEEVRE